MKIVWEEQDAAGNWMLSQTEVFADAGYYALRRELEAKRGRIQNARLVFGSLTLFVFADFPLTEDLARCGVAEVSAQ